VFEDSHLIRRMRRGDPEALRRVYQKYKDTLMTVAFCLLGEVAAAEDCLHDVFVRFAGRAADLRFNGSLKGYLTVCVANRARDLLRSKARQGVWLEAARIAADPAATPLENLAGREELSRLRAGLAALPYQQREVIVMHLHGQLKFRRIAENLGVSANTVKSRYRYGLEKLRDALGAGGPP
jgi:RNA polymerase sigma-70 factor (ECF subfamily)